MKVRPHLAIDANSVLNALVFAFGGTDRHNENFLAD